MAACRRDQGARWVDAGPCHEPVVNRLFQGKGRAAEVPDGCEAPHQRPLGLGARGKKDVADVCRKQGSYRERREDRMPMRVDQTRHHDPSATIDHPRAVRRGQLAGRDQLDAIALDEEAKPSAQGSGLSIEKQKIPEHDWRRGAGRSRLRAGWPNKPERRERGAHPGDEAASRHFPVDSTRGELKLRQATKTGRTIGRSA